MWTKLFWMRTSERAVRAFAISFLGVASVAERFAPGSMFGLKERAVMGATQALGSILLSLAGSNVGDKTSPDILTSPPDTATELSGRDEADVAVDPEYIPGD